MERKKFSIFFGFLASIAMSLGLASGAGAVTIEPDADINSSDVETEGDWTVIPGGTTQSDDPEDLYYVPEVPQLVKPDLSGPQIEPLSASGYQIIPGYEIGIKGVAVQVPQGLLFQKISGSGTQIDRDYADYEVAASLNYCNWRIDFQNRTGSKVHKTWKGPSHYECKWLGGAKASATAHPGKVKPGLQCARLFVNGTFRGEQCHNITL